MTDTATKPAKTRKPNVGSDPTKGSRTKLWQIGLYAFALGASAIMLTIAIGIIARGGFSYIAIVVALLVTGLSWSLVSSKNDGYIEPQGLSIRNAEPHLQEFVESVAAEVNAPMPDKVHLVTEAEFDLREKTRFFGVKVEESALVLGLPYLHALTRQELAAVVAHELGHFSEGAINEGPRSTRALQAASHLISVERQGFVNAVYGSYARKVFRSVGGVGVAQEQAAEDAAAAAYGSDALRSALSKFDEIAITYDELLREYVVPALQNKLHPEDMFSGFDQMRTSTVRVEARARLVSKRQEKTPNEFELHRSPTERVSALDSRTDVARVTVRDAQRGAHTLLDEDARSTAIVVGTWASKLMNSSTEPRSWQELADEIYSVNSHNSAVAGFDVDEADADAMSHFETALRMADDAGFAAVDERLAALAPKKDKTSAVDRRRNWAESVVLEAAAAQHGYRWQHDWDGTPHLVDENGVSFDPSAVADLLVEADVDGARAAFAAG